MTERDLDAFIDAGAAVLGLPIAAEWRPAVRLHLAISLDHAAKIAGFTPPDE